MRIRFGELWERLNTSYWFVPTVMAALGVTLAFGMIRLDQAVSSDLVRRLGWVYRGGPEGATGVLTAIAGSMITIAGLVFSLTLVALTLASSQFGPRLLRNFIRDRVTQFVMGTFLASFLYCLFVLRTIRRDDGDEFVPHVSVTVGVVLAVAGLVMLVYFIHHLATSIQADTLIARVASELAAATDHLYPEDIGTGTPEPPAPPKPTGPFDTVTAGEDGYVQIVESDRVMAAADRWDVTVELVHRPGHFVAAGGPLARVWPAERLDGRLADEIAQAVVLGPVRTPGQDVEFVMGQLVEVAVRALSPGINDPFTALTCIDRLAAGLARLARRKPPSPYRLGRDGRLRVLAKPVRFPDLVDTAFNQIRQYGRGNAAVLIRLLEVLADLAAVVASAPNRDALRKHAEMVARAANESLPEENDRNDARDRIRTMSDLVRGLDAPANPPT
ncbi:MAG TPA: DUF2254 domain-containing protein [Gemmata sp.]|nr:DUF2254 domain-containing protein [Gemmata sp.]